MPIGRERIQESRLRKRSFLKLENELKRILEKLSEAIDAGDRESLDSLNGFIDQAEKALDVMFMRVADAPNFSLFFFRYRRRLRYRSKLFAMVKGSVREIGQIMTDRDIAGIVQRYRSEADDLNLD